MAVHEDIANGVAGVVRALSLPGMTVRAQATVFRAEGDPDRLTIITMGAERDVEFYTGGDVLREYEIVLSVSLPSNAQLVTDIGDAKQVRQQCRNALVNDHNSVAPILPTVPVVRDVVPVDLPALPEDAHRSNWSVARLGLIYRTCETTRG